MCYYSWCWDCGATFTENHGWLCNPFGCNISKNSLMRHPILRWLLRLLYVILGLLLFPILLVLFVPIASAYKGAVIVSEALDSWYLHRNREEFDEFTHVVSDSGEIQPHR